MSRVYVYTIGERNVFKEVGEARNANAFHVSIWRHLGIKHHGWKDDWSWWSTHGPQGHLELLWKDIAKLPRIDGLAMASTFDRCWFPWALLGETAAALDAISSHATTASEVADILREQKDPARGFTFASSLAGAWSCSAIEDEDSEGRWHHHVRFGKNEHACCHEGCTTDDIENAAEIVAPA